MLKPQLQNIFWRNIAILCLFTLKICVSFYDCEKLIPFPKNKSLFCYINLSNNKTNEKLEVESEKKLDWLDFSIIKLIFKVSEGVWQFKDFDKCNIIIMNYIKYEVNYSFFCYVKGIHSTK